MRTTQTRMRDWFGLHSPCKGVIWTAPQGAVKRPAGRIFLQEAPLSGAVFNGKSYLFSAPAPGLVWIACIIYRDDGTPIAACGTNVTDLAAGQKTSFDLSASHLMNLDIGGSGYQEKAGSHPSQAAPDKFNAANCFSIDANFTPLIQEKPSLQFHGLDRTNRSL